MNTTSPSQLKFKTIMKHHSKPWPLILLALSCFSLHAQEPNPKPGIEEATAEQVGVYLNRVYGDETPPEGAKMLLAIIQGSQMGPGEGWFGPAQSRFDYAWLSRLCSVEGSKGIEKNQFVGPPELFSVLDRNRDGVIQPADLDWSSSNPYVEQAYLLNRIFRRMDIQGSGALSRDDWLAIFENATQGKDQLTAADFSGTLLAGYTGSFSSGDRPDTAQLIRGLFAGEIGSMFEGPKIGQQAPVFKLRKAQGEGFIELSSLIGEKPLVIVLGNFTCGPFRSFYPEVDALFVKYQDRANFLMVYVREAHPSDGWKMESNSKVGVDVAQPKTIEERVGVANQFCTKLNPRMPVVIDELSDPVGHAYSGMPARLYVIDTKGKVAFKSGRGPFGFSPPELEQALAMSLLDTAQAPTASTSSFTPETWIPLSDEETWKRLPEATEGTGMPTRTGSSTGSE